MASHVLLFVVTLVSMSFAHGDYMNGRGIGRGYRDNGFDDSGMFVGDVGGVQGGLLGGQSQIVGGVGGGVGGGMDLGFEDIDDGFVGIGGGLGGVSVRGMYDHKSGMVGTGGYGRGGGISGGLLGGFREIDSGFGLGGMDSRWSRKMKMGGGRLAGSRRRGQGGILGGGFGGRRLAGSTGRRTIGIGGIGGMKRRHFKSY